MPRPRVLWLIAGALAGFSVASVIAVRFDFAPDPVTTAYAGFHASILALILFAVGWQRNAVKQETALCAACGSALDADLGFCPACGERVEHEPEADPKGRGSAA